MPEDSAGTVPLCIVSDAAGNLWVTESFGGRVMRIEADDASRTDNITEWMASPLRAPGGNGFGANGLTLVDGQLVVSNGDSGMLFPVSPNSADPADDLTPIALTEGGVEVTLCGPDGLSAVPGTSDVVVVENGFCASAIPRVSRVSIEGL